jgi:hypothetical protein
VMPSAVDALWAPLALFGLACGTIAGWLAWGAGHAAGQRMGYQTGYDAGYSAGRATGLRDGHEAGLADVRMGVAIDPDAAALAYQRGMRQGMRVPRSEYAPG